jgi:hypothetical protein
MSTFQIVGLEDAQFAHLFTWSDEKLASIGALRKIVDASPGYPCRVSLEDAEVGEEVLLLNFQHHDTDSPYRACGPIFIRKDVAQGRWPVGYIDQYVSSRLISLRAYDVNGMMVSATVIDGKLASAELEKLFERSDVSYVHLHNAKPGCFSCVARRIGGITLA